MKCLKAGRWQKRAKHLYRGGYGDCDKISMKIVEEMKAQGLVVGKDFVAVHGRIDGVRHMYIELWGKYRIDGTSSSYVSNIWKGEYAKS